MVLLASRRRRHRLERASIAAVMIFAVSLAACSAGQVSNKTGSDVVVLKFATVDDLNPNGQEPAPGVFINALERLSGGRIKVTVTDDYENGSPTAETDIVKSIATGQIDGGWPATRAFARAGISGLEPVEAPMMLTSYAAQEALAAGPGGAALLKTLDGSGVFGLGLTVGPLRQPWSRTAALVDPARWRGVTFRSYNSPVEDATIRALGGVPIEASFDFPDLVEQGRLQGAETDVAQYDRNGYGPLLPRTVANVVLWPRMEVLALSQKRYDSLTAKQREWVREAAEQAVKASITYPYDETTPAHKVCAEGVRFYSAQPAQLAQLRRAVQPVIKALARNPATASSLADVESAAARFPTADSITLPSNCRGH